jgi:hypothetical protein
VDIFCGQEPFSYRLRFGWLRDSVRDSEIVSHLLYQFGDEYRLPGFTKGYGLAGKFTLELVKEMRCGLTPVLLEGGNDLLNQVVQLSLKLIAVLYPRGIIRSHLPEETLDPFDQDWFDLFTEYQPEIIMPEMDNRSA